MINHPHGNALSGRGVSGPAETGKSLITAAEVMAVLRRWWWQCTLAGFVCAAAAIAAVWSTFTPVYEALALLLIKTDPDYIAFKTQTNGFSFAWNQLETLRSPIVLSRVASKPGVANQLEAEEFGDVDRWLAKMLDVRFIGRSDLCEVKFRSKNPEVAAAVANAVVEEYLALHVDRESEQADRIIALLLAQQRERQSEVETLRGNVRTLLKKTTGREPLIIQGDNSTVVTQNPLAELEERRVAAEVEYDVSAAQLQAYQDAAADKKVEITSEELQQAIFERPEVQRLNDHAAYLEHILFQTRRTAARGDKDPAVTSKTKELATAREAVEKAVERFRPIVAKELERELSAKQVEKIQDLRVKVEVQKRLLAQWEEKVEKERKEMELHGDDRLTLKFAEDDLQRSEEVHARIAERIVALKTEKVAPARATMQHEAKTPKEPVEKIPYRKLAIAGLGAFLAPFGLAFLWERLSRRVSDGDRLAAESKMLVLGEVASLPTLRAAGKLPSANYYRERVTFEESVDALRVTLTLLPECKDIRTLLVTSAISGEGKTNVATSLAASLARATHEPLLIIDGDMRDPNLHEIFDVSAKPGLANVLEDLSSLDDAIVQTGVENVDLLPAGKLRFSPHFLLRNGAFRSILDRTKEKYRYVIVDSPPVLSASEAVVLAHACDGVLICTRCDYSRSPQLCAAKERLVGAGANVLGAVINGLPTRSWAQRYGGYGYGWERYASAYHSFNAPQSLTLEDSERSADSGSEGHV